VIVFTAEEVWGTRYPEGGSVHLLEWPELPFCRHPREGGGPSPNGSVQSDGEEMDRRLRGDDEYFHRWKELRQLRDQVNEAIEPLRRSKEIRSSLEAVVVVGHELASQFTNTELAELFIVASVDRRQGNVVTVTRTDDQKCGRCWRLLPEVPEDGALCARCADVVGEVPA
jgi:isoleucyl-tRNA synthetase